MGIKIVKCSYCGTTNETNSGTCKYCGGVLNFEDNKINNNEEKIVKISQLLNNKLNEAFVVEFESGKKDIAIQTGKYTYESIINNLKYFDSNHFYNRFNYVEAHISFEELLYFISYTEWIRLKKEYRELKRLKNKIEKKYTPLCINNITSLNSYYTAEEMQKALNDELTNKDAALIIYRVINNLPPLANTQDGLKLNQQSKKA